MLDNIREGGPGRLGNVFYRIPLKRTVRKIDRLVSGEVSTRVNLFVVIIIQVVVQYEQIRAVITNTHSKMFFFRQRRTVELQLRKANSTARSRRRGDNTMTDWEPECGGRA